MFEKVNPMHPDKIADRIAGAIVDTAYSKCDNPHIAVEVLIGHGKCHIIAESDVQIDGSEISEIVWRITQDNTVEVDYQWNMQDVHLNQNQKGVSKCGDNGIFKGMPVTNEQYRLAEMAKTIYNAFPSDGKYILDDESERFIICQSNATSDAIKYMYPEAIVNPLGDWTGGINVDTGVTNRKLGSDMGDSVTGGGIHGKDLSKADVSVNIHCWVLSQRYNTEVTALCAIGDTEISFKYKYNGERQVKKVPFTEVIEKAKKFVNDMGGFEKFAEWGLID